MQAENVTALKKLATLRPEVFTYDQLKQFVKLLSNDAGFNVIDFLKKAQVLASNLFKIAQDWVLNVNPMEPE